MTGKKNKNKNKNVSVVSLLQSLAGGSGTRRSVQLGLRRQRNARSTPRGSNTTYGVRYPLSKAAQEWDALLRDPCGGPVCSPCYAGTESGLLVRVTSYFQPQASISGGTVGAITRGDYYAQWTPYNCHTTTSGIMGLGAMSNGSIIPVEFGLSSFINNGTPARMRPVAACAKWVPSGPYGARAGLVGLGYTPGTIIFPGTSVVSYRVNDLLESCQVSSPNGSEVHEVRFLPTPVDEIWHSKNDLSSTGAGTIHIALQGVDSTCDSSVVMSANGRIEYTAVYEWIPSTQGTNIQMSVKPPSAVTAQDVLSSIPDISTYIFKGVRGVMSLAARATPIILSAGVRQVTYTPRQRLLM